MQTHIKVIGWLYILSSALNLVGALCLGVILVGAGIISNDDIALSVTSIVAIVAASFILLISFPGILAGIGLLRRQPWARILALVLGVLNLPAFPFGTILGVYSLYALLDDDTQALFNPPP